MKALLLVVPAGLMAMAFGILGSVTGGMVIDEAECVSKTFPQFWDVLKTVGGKVKISGE